MLKGTLKGAKYWKGFGVGGVFCTGSGMGVDFFAATVMACTEIAGDDGDERSRRG